MASSLDKLNKVREDFVKAVGTEADERQFNVVLGIESVKGLTGAELDDSLKTLNEREFPAFDLARKLEAQVNELIGLLREVVQIADKSQLGIARERFNAVVIRIRRDMVAADKIAPNAARTRTINAVIDVGEGSSGVVEVRQRDIVTQDSINAGLREIDKAAAAMRAEVDKLVKSARTDAVAASAWFANDAVHFAAFAA